MKKLIAALSLIGLLLISVTAQAHGGRTDKNGCHYDRKAGTKHCH